MSITFLKNDAGRYRVAATGAEADTLDDYPSHSAAAAGKRAFWADPTGVAGEYEISRAAADAIGYRGSS